MTKLDKEIQKYLQDNDVNETTALLIIFMKQIEEISIHLENISNKLWE
jgi:predicted transcriptional regulator